MSVRVFIRTIIASSMLCFGLTAFSGVASATSVASYEQSPGRSPAQLFDFGLKDLLAQRKEREADRRADRDEARRKHFEYLTGRFSDRWFETHCEQGRGRLCGDAVVVTPPATDAVPVPAAVWLFGSALTGLLVWRRKVRA